MFQDLIFPLLCQAKSRTFLLPPPTIQKKRILPGDFIHFLESRSIYPLSTITCDCIPTLTGSHNPPDTQFSDWNIRRATRSCTRRPGSGRWLRKHIYYYGNAGPRQIHDPRT